MNKEKAINAIKIINLLALAGIGLFLFLGSGATLLLIFESFNFRIIILGFTIAFLFGLVSFRKSYFLLISLLGWTIFGLGNMVDKKQVREENQKLCIELRAEPTCKEDACGFNCSNFHGAGFVTGGSICNDKDMSLCREKVEQDTKNESASKDALEIYSNIVDKIISSPSPTSENFENELVAIYNCLEEKYGPGATGELKAIQILKQKNLTTQQLDKYYSYHSSKGRNFTPGHITAGLPSGDKNLSCEFINVK